MNISLSEHFNFKKLFRFTMPSIIMMVFTSIYGVVDGLFVSNIVGETAFTAVNFIMPVTMILSAVGFMFGTGGSALVSKTLGEGDRDKANRIFSLVVYTTTAAGVILGALGIALMRVVASALGAEGEMLENSVLYGRIIVGVLPLFMLQMAFQSLFVTAEKPKLGLFVTVLSGVTNMVLDALFVAVFRWGIVGAAAATAASQLVGGVVPLIYFLRKNDSLLRLGKTRLNWRVLGKTCSNGSSEFVSQSSMSIVNMLYNTQLIKYAGEGGVAAYGVMMYVNLVFLAIFIGYSIGVAPIVGYNYGAKNSAELRNIRRKSIFIIVVTSVVMLAVSELSADALAGIFVGKNPELCELTARGFRIFSISFIFAGMNIFGSSFFTALNNGIISALISFLRTLVFQIGAVLILPLFMQTDGIFLSVAVAEVTAFVLTVSFIVAKKKKYNY